MSLETNPEKRLIGYARVSTQQQDIARQTKALKRLGCAVIYSDTASGKSLIGRPQLARAKGVKMGRKPKLTPHQMKEARQRIAKGEATRDLAKSYGVSISTISRLQCEQLSNVASAASLPARSRGRMLIVLRGAPGSN